MMENQGILSFVLAHFGFPIHDFIIWKKFKYFQSYKYIWKKFTS